MRAGETGGVERVEGVEEFGKGGTQNFGVFEKLNQRGGEKEKVKLHTLKEKKQFEKKIFFFFFFIFPVWRFKVCIFIN